MKKRWEKRRVFMISSVQLLSHVQLFANPWTAAGQIPCPSPTPEAYSNSCPLSQWCNPAISFSVILFSLLPSIFPRIRVFSNESVFFASGGRSIGVSASASVLPMNIQDWFPVKLTSLISCSPRDSQESSQTPQFKSINSSMLSFLYGSTLISIHDYWKNHNFDQMGICR